MVLLVEITDGRDAGSAGGGGARLAVPVDLIGGILATGFLPCG